MPGGAALAPAYRMVSGVNIGDVMPGGAALAPAYGMVSGVNPGNVMPGGAALTGQVRSPALNAC